MKHQRKYRSTKVGKRAKAVRDEVEQHMRYRMPISVDLRAKSGAIVTVIESDDRNSITLAQVDAGVIVVSGEALARALRAFGYDLR